MSPLRSVRKRRTTLRSSFRLFLGSIEYSIRSSRPACLLCSLSSCSTRREQAPCHHRPVVRPSPVLGPGLCFRLFLGPASSLRSTCLRLADAPCLPAARGLAAAQPVDLSGLSYVRSAPWPPSFCFPIARGDRQWARIGNGRPTDTSTAARRVTSGSPTPCLSPSALSRAGSSAPPVPSGTLRDHSRESRPRRAAVGLFRSRAGHIG